MGGENGLALVEHGFSNINHGHSPSNDGDIIAPEMVCHWQPDGLLRSPQAMPKRMIAGFQYLDFNAVYNQKIRPYSVRSEWPQVPV
jgi:hypothetical protein